MDELDEPDGIDLKAITTALNKSETYQDFKQILMHALGETTKTDEGIHQKNLAHVKEIKIKKTPMVFNPNIHKASFIEDEFEEFR